MAQLSIKLVLDRLRKGIKGTNPDAFMTDRYLYSLYKKYGSVLMRRQDSVNKLMKYNSVFQELEHFDTEQIPVATLTGGYALSDELITRTKDPLPAMHEGYFGPLLRSVSSLDRSIKLQPTYPDTYKNLSSRSDARFNKVLYYWYLDGRLYFPQVHWKAVRIEGVYEGDVSHINKGVPYCDYFQSQSCNIPEFLSAEIEQMIRQELSGLLVLPNDKTQDNQSILK